MSDFRALDVDRWDEEPLTAADLAVEDPRSAQVLLQIAQQKQTGVRTRLARYAAPTHAAATRPARSPRCLTTPRAGTTPRRRSA